MAKRRCDVTNMNLAGEGRKKILWADRDMPVLALIRARFEKQKTLRGVRGQVHRGFSFGAGVTTLCGGG